MTAQNSPSEATIFTNAGHTHYIYTPLGATKTLSLWHNRTRHLGTRSWKRDGLISYNCGLMESTGDLVHTPYLQISMAKDGRGSSRQLLESVKSQRHRREASYLEDIPEMGVAAPHPDREVIYLAHINEAQLIEQIFRFRC